jgi:3-oxoacyl-[acyl-carrier-protein] synthase III
LDARQKRALGLKLRGFFRLTGTKVRHHRAPEEKILDFGVKAGREALRKAELAPGKVDLVIYGGISRGWLEPSTASVFQSELGLVNSTCFDILDACAGWIRSMHVAKSLIDQGTYRTVMILNCEFHCVDGCVDYELAGGSNIDRVIGGYTLGDAATATILAADGNADNFYFTIKSWGEKHDLCKIPLPQARHFNPEGASNHMKAMQFHTDSSQLFSFTLQNMLAHFEGDPVLPRQAYDLVIGHAASVASSRQLAKNIRVDESLLVETRARFGNTASASLPLGLAVAEEEGRLKRGTRVLLGVGAAGVSSAYCSFRH